MAPVCSLSTEISPELRGSRICSFTDSDIVGEILMQFDANRGRTNSVSRSTGGRGQCQQALRSSGDGERRALLHSSYSDEAQAVIPMPERHDAICTDGPQF